jgi:hypothetical protein
VARYLVLTGSRWVRKIEPLRPSRFGPAPFRGLSVDRTLCGDNLAHWPAPKSSLMRKRLYGGFLCSQRRLPSHQIVQRVPTDEGEVPSSHARTLIDASPLDPAADLTGTLRDFPDRRGLLVILWSEVPQCFQEFALILRRTFPRHAPHRIPDHIPNPRSPIGTSIEIVAEIRRTLRLVSTAMATVMAVSANGQLQWLLTEARHRGECSRRRIPHSFNGQSSAPI